MLVPARSPAALGSSRRIQPLIKMLRRLPTNSCTSCSMCFPGSKYTRPARNGSYPEGVPVEQPEDDVTQILRAALRTGTPLGLRSSVKNVYQAHGVLPKHTFGPRHFGFCRAFRGYGLSLRASSSYETERIAARALSNSWNASGRSTMSERGLTPPSWHTSTITVSSFQP